MSYQNELKSEISSNHLDFQEISSKHKALFHDSMARGVRFEPTR